MSAENHLEKLKKILHRALMASNWYDIQIALIEADKFIQTLDKEAHILTKFKSGDTVYAKEDIHYPFTSGIVPTGTVGVLSEYPMEGYDERVYGGVKWTGIEISLAICTRLGQLTKSDCEHEEPVCIRSTEVESRVTVQWCSHCGSIRFNGVSREWDPWMNPRIKHS
jgi:hypothetical protein